MSAFKDFFSYDGPFLTFMEKLIWVFLTNLFLIVMCIPIITIGPAVKATYAVMFRLTKDKKADFFFTFFNSFFSNLGTSIIASLCTILALGIAGFDIIFFFIMGGTFGYLGMAASILIFLAILTFVICFYPILSRNEGKFKETLRETWIFVNMYLKQAIQALFTVIVTVVIMIAIVSVPEFGVFMYFLLIALGICALIIAYIFEKIYVCEEGEEL
jgi:hypothetical protein